MGSKIANPVERKKSKNQQRRERAKLLKQKEQQKVKKVVKNKANVKKAAIETNNTDGDGTEKPGPVDENLAELYKDIFQKFEPSTEDEEESETKEQVQNQLIVHETDKEENTETEEQTVEDSIPPNNTTLSKRQFKKKYGIPLYVLKSECKHPELVEWVDADAADPRLHIYLKTLPNVVPVPQHWKSKKSFLSTKRGIERPPFELPQFIKDTGISEMRPTTDNIDGDSSSTLKQRTRERVQPKVGQLDLDYDRLYDAFFKYQKKPTLLKFGECYTESMNYNNNTENNTIPQNNSNISRTRHWGDLVNDLDTSEKSTKIPNKVRDPAYEPSRGDVLVEKIGQSQYRAPPRQSNTSNAPKSLYRVLQTQQNVNDESIFGSKTTSYRYR